LVVTGLLLLLAVSRVLIAQTTNTGGLTGVVTDPSHAVVPDVDVEITDNRKGNVQSTRTDREGVYRFFFLAPSPYTLTITHAGFRQESRAVNVLLGPPGTVNVALEIAKTSSEITVTDEAPNIQAENGDVSTTMNQKQISEVPNPGNDLTIVPAIRAAANNHYRRAAQRHVGNALQPNHPGQWWRRSFHLDGERGSAAS
jgi:hypothetical protein